MIWRIIILMHWCVFMSCALLPTCVIMSLIHGTKRKPHSWVTWNLYHFVAVSSFLQPRPMDLADINTRLQLSNTWFHATDAWWFFLRMVSIRLIWFQGCSLKCYGPLYGVNEWMVPCSFCWICGMDAVTPCWWPLYSFHVTYMISICFAWLRLFYYVLF